MKNQKAITLISLVITIVVLIILASVAIYLSLGEKGIFKRAKEAKEVTNKQTATEIINLKITNCQMNKYAEKQVMPTLKELSLVLKEDNEIVYVTEKSQEKSQVASKKYEVGENPSSIYTKLNNYPYEFEINSSLQLASIDGVRLATEDNVTLSREEYNNIINRLEFLENNKGKIVRVTLGFIYSKDPVTFDVTDYPGYENFTVDNFGCSIIKGIHMGQYNTYEEYGSISYDPKTGIVTYPYAGRDINYGTIVSYEAYLYYIDYTE